MSEKEPLTPRRAAGRPRKGGRSPKGEKRYLQITLMLDAPLLAALDALAEAEGMRSRSEIVRHISREYLRRAAKRAGRNADMRLAAILQAAAEEEAANGPIARFVASLKEHAGQTVPEENEE